MSNEASDNNAAAIEAYEKLLAFVCEPLLGSSDFQIQSAVRDGELAVRLRAPSNLRGRVIGRGGRIANAIRHVLENAAIETDLTPTFEIADE
jgi:predicted RNA-binding protein YlqC (UPF0109 family)